MIKKIGSLPEKSHSCYLYSSPEEVFDFTLSFLEYSHNPENKIVYLGRDFKKLKLALKKRKGISGEKNQLISIEEQQIKEAYGKKEVFNFWKDNLKNIFSKTEKETLNAKIVVLVDMAWLEGCKVDFSYIFNLEKKINNLVEIYPLKIVCMYPCRNFYGMFLNRICKDDIHPYILTKP